MAINAASTRRFIVLPIFSNDQRQAHSQFESTTREHRHTGDVPSIAHVFEMCQPTRRSKTGVGRHDGGTWRLDGSGHEAPVGRAGGRSWEAAYEWIAARRRPQGPSGTVGGRSRGLGSPSSDCGRSQVSPLTPR
jgi:hypothetical protein